jgi:DNA-binding response OmpR family regulator
MNAKRAGKLLLVEDEHVLRGLIAQFLRFEAFEVIEAADGQEALERFTALQPFDVVLLDLNLPIYCGLEVCRRIKIEWPSQQVLICSAAIMDSDIDVLQSLGVERFLTKPYHPLDLLAGIDLAMGRCDQAFSSRAGRYFGRPHGSIRTIDSVLPASQTLVK